MAVDRITSLEAQLGESQAELGRLSLIDELTGLNSRRGFCFLAEQQLKLVRRQSVRAELGLIAIDDLDAINSKLGCDIGSSAVLEVSQVMQTSFRDSDVLGRVSGDEFAVFVVNPSVDANVLRQRIEADLATRNSDPGRKFELAVSIGFVDSWDADDLEGLVDRARVAMQSDRLNKHRPL